MIENRKVSNVDKRKINKELKHSGYISATHLSIITMEKKKSINLIGFAGAIKELRRIFIENNNLRCICLDYGFCNHSYWYNIEDLNKLALNVENEQQYNTSLRRIEELLPLVTDQTPTNDENYIELVKLSNMVADYEDNQ